MRRCLLAISCLLALMLLPAACASSTPSNLPNPTSPHIGPIENLIQLTTQSPILYSGDEPATNAHYQQLAALGIKTVISVDAIAPDPVLENRHTIRIVHLPIGYDGIDHTRAIELAAAIYQLEDPIYLHCHHGKHRGPAALAVGAIGAGLITNDQALEFMTDAGTSTNYPGLWNAAATATPLDQSTLNSTQSFPPRAPVSGLVDAMGKIDRLHERLWDMAEDDWKTPPDHPDLSPTAVSSQIHDLLRSLLDSDIITQEGFSMRTELESSVQAAQSVEDNLNQGNVDEAMIQLDLMSQLCIRCHDRFRD